MKGLNQCTLFYPITNFRALKQLDSENNFFIEFLQPSNVQPHKRVSVRYFFPSEVKPYFPQKSGEGGWGSFANSFEGYKFGWIRRQNNWQNLASQIFKSKSIISNTSMLHSNNDFNKLIQSPNLLQFWVSPQKRSPSPIFLQCVSLCTILWSPAEIISITIIGDEIPNADQLKVQLNPKGPVDVVTFEKNLRWWRKDTISWALVLPCLWV
jgi:hypothetical protein